MNPAVAYFLNVPEPYKEVILYLDSVIQNTVPEVLLRYKWKMPFYYLDEKTMFCFLNFKKTYIDIGLPYGVHLSDPKGLLIAENRKMMRSLRYSTLEAVQTEDLLQFLLELKELRSK